MKYGLEKDSQFAGKKRAVSWQGLLRPLRLDPPSASPTAQANNGIQTAFQVSPDPAASSSLSAASSSPAISRDTAASTVLQRPSASSEPTASQAFTASESPKPQQPEKSASSKETKEASFSERPNEESNIVAKAPSAEAIGRNGTELSTASKAPKTGTKSHEPQRASLSGLEGESATGPKTGDFLALHVVKFY